MAAQIAHSETRSSNVIQTESLAIAHHIATEVGEYWDIVYAGCINDDEIDELVDLEERVFQRYGVRLERLVVERKESARPHPWFPHCDSYTYVRLCPRMALEFN
ncbi:hypothetical protein ACWC5I_00270 [Kitasatospora sp. NPDC001574]